MATRGMIARKTETGMVGREHHWDAYPEALGKTLYSLYNNHFSKDIEAMMHTLIDEHPAGWSSIVDTNFAFTPGFSTRDWDLPEEHEINSRPQCYCHGQRREQGKDLTSFSDARRMGAEYVYIIDASTRTMAIHERDGEVWSEIAVVNLDAGEPVWQFLGESDEEE